MGKLYEENWYQKWAKITILGKIPEAVPIQVQHRYRYRDAPVQVQGCTGTGVPEMPRMLYFRIFKPKFIHR